jgi:hypothetical protein
MTETLPTTTGQWSLTGADGAASLTYSEQPVPELGDHDVLVKSEFQLLLWRLVSSSLAAI